ncbi:MAG: serine/threonine protein kinase [Phycisphaerae bacterium]|nr:serine/threonine protein kinase [Phycisphaerae bacterium]
MDADRFRRIDEIFNHARSLEQDDRTAFLSAACGEDRSLRSEVEALLNHDDHPDALFRTPAIKAGLQFSSLGGSVSIAPADSPIPESIGGYRIQRVLGEGGFGVVYLAIQDNPSRTVALKVIRESIATPQMLKRFDYEAQILGRLTHPGIAQVYEAGTEGTGRGTRAFFAMEYIEGKRLDHYADDMALAVEKRLDLLARVCDAVQYAHQKGVIHRDLKPQNILVDELGNPRILDFGVSRTTDSDIYTTTLHTTAGQLIGTLPYMSPEQVTGDPTEVDTRSDIYALGVILYLLMTGKLPHDLGSRSIAEAARVIRDEQPTRLSSFSRAFRGDVDTIVLKAMEKDKTRRYQSAAELATDIRRHLRGEPIEAKRNSGWYVLQKTLRRYKLLATVSASFVVVLILASIALAQLYRRAELQAGIARTERDTAQEATRQAQQETERARIEESRATAIKNFMLRLLQSADTRSARGEDRTVREMLDSVDPWLEKSLAAEPQVVVAIRETTGQVYLSMGLYEQAANQFEKALATAETFRSEEPAVYSKLKLHRAVVHEKTGRLEEAEAETEESLNTLRQLYPPDHPDIGWALMNLAGIRMSRGRLDGIEQMLTTAVEIARNAPKTGCPQENEDSDLAATIGILGAYYFRQRDFDNSERCLREAIEVGVAKLGENHPTLAPIYNNLAALLDTKGRLDESLPYFRKSLEAARTTMGPNHPDVAYALCGLGQALTRLQQFEEALQLFNEAIQIRRDALPSNHPLIAVALTGAGRALNGLGKPDQAEAILREAYEIRLATAPPNDYGRNFTAAILGECLVQLGKLDEAEQILITAYEGIVAARGPTFAIAQGAAANLAKLYDARGDTAKAAEWSERSNASE